MRSSNASASAFGWEFQSNAAIMLMLRNIVVASKVKVEGNTEDIEIALADGTMMMSQAKAVFDPDDSSHVKDKLVAGLRTLSEAAKQPNVAQLIFVTNSPNPFNKAESMYKFSSPINSIPFFELPVSCQQVIDDICTSKGYKFDTSLLTICVMQFHGENEDERYKVLSTLTMEFLNGLNVHRVSVEQLLQLWQHSFMVNASQLVTTITKKQMVWPVIAISCDVSEDAAALSDYDDSDVAEILQNYRRIINNNCESFEFTAKILSDYTDFEPHLMSRQRIEQFIACNWCQYVDYFDIQTSSAEIKEVVIRLTLENVLRTRKTISDIKNRVRL